MHAYTHAALVLPIFLLYLLYASCTILYINTIYTNLEQQENPSTFKSPEEIMKESSRQTSGNLGIMATNV